MSSEQSMKTVGVPDCVFDRFKLFFVKSQIGSVFSPPILIAGSLKKVQPVEADCGAHIRLSPPNSFVERLRQRFVKFNPLVIFAILRRLSSAKRHHSHQIIPTWKCTHEHDRWATLHHLRRSEPAFIEVTQQYGPYLCGIFHRGRITRAANAHKEDIAKGIRLVGLNNLRQEADIPSAFSKYCDRAAAPNQ